MIARNRERFKIAPSLTWGALAEYDLSMYLLLNLFLLFFLAAEREPVGLNADAEKQEAAFVSNIRQLVFEGRRSGEGYFSRDGSLLIFQSEREPDNPFFQMYLMDMNSGDTSRVSPGHGKTTCGWIHPSNRKVLFSSTHHDPQARQKQDEEFQYRASGQPKRYGWEFDDEYDIYEADLAGSGLRNLTDSAGYDAEGAYSPDGRLIVFASNRHAFTEDLSEADRKRFEQDKSYLMDIYLMDADGGNVRRMTREKGYDGGPFFSFDGERICWRRFSEDGATAEIYTMRADGSDQKQLTRLGAMSWAPFFHPSGDYLIFATNRHGFGNFELYLVDSEGGSEPARVTFTDGFDGLPAFSPEGDRLVWTSVRTANRQAQLFMADWNDGAAREALGLPEWASATASSGSIALVGAPDLQLTQPEIRAEDLQMHLTYLASDFMEGRLTGTEGERRATEYVASVFQSLGLRPAGDEGAYFQEYPFTAGVSPGPGNRLSLQADGSAEIHYLFDQDWRPLAFSQTGDFSAPVVFAGYGLRAPPSGDFPGYDSFQDLDVKDKWVLVFRYLPEELSPEVRQHLSRFSSLRYKAMAAREQGAKGLMVVSGPNSKVREELVRIASDAASAGSGVAAISITDRLAGEILKAAGRDLGKLQTEYDKDKPLPGFQVPSLTVAAAIDIVQERRVGRNVLAKLPAGEASALSSVVIGAHLDHLGRGDGPNSLAQEEEKGMIHFGADDNASGVAGLLEIAQYFADRKARGALPLKHNILFAAWTGEELGLLGSAHFARTFGSGDRPDLRPDIVAYLNMDMIGRLDKSLVLQGVGSSSFWPREIEKRNVPIGLPVVTQNESYLPTDATSFYLRKVPILSAFTGAHQEYHTPRDTADRINYPGTQKITRLMAAITESLATSDSVPDYIEMERPQRMGGGGRRVYLGTIPDFSQEEVVGVRLAGVQKEGPADQAGLRAGDIIVELAGTAIANIYDYQFALGALKVGEPAGITVLRDGQRVSLTITPGSRD
jgi:Tol biopolymer transport system component